MIDYRTAYMKLVEDVLQVNRDVLKYAEALVRNGNNDGGRALIHVSDSISTVVNLVLMDLDVSEDL